MDNTHRRFARLYNSDEAQIILEDLPPDLSQEEDDSDREHPLYEPELEMNLAERRGNLANNNVCHTSEGPTNSSPQPTRKWKKKEKLNTSAPFQNAEGPRLCEFENCRQPVDFFLKYWDGDIEENILRETNQYQIQKGRTGQPIILEELRGFLAVNMVMGYHVLPSYRHYWSNQPDLGVPLLASVMTKKQICAHPRQLSQLSY
ncbi:hypothetical protein RRG08_016420 [Elysia crispata]|uniref:PiggyBac transposable element-derived protein domain-containing protein n=1 Tax=Elysia crispata TaxID=231223 RepID=A0AAE0Y8R8_9GAST|nr:hypothetical protein RRG08_016420 [Elysia crispata]